MWHGVLLVFHSFNPFLIRFTDPQKAVFRLHWIHSQCKSFCLVSNWGCKKTLITFTHPVFCYLFFLPYRFTGDCDYSNKYNRFSIVNNIVHNITTQLKYYQRWLRDGSRRQREQAQASYSSRGRRQRCSRRQRQQQEEAAAASAAAVEQEQEAAVKGTSCNNIWVLEQAVQDVACLFRLHDSSFAADGCHGQVLDKRILFAKTLSFRLSFCYRFGLRFSYVFVYVEASMQCDKKRTTRWAGSKWTAWLLSLAAWMCNSCSLAAGLLGSLVARQLSRLTAWQLYIYKCK